MKRRTHSFRTKIFLAMSLFVLVVAALFGSLGLTMIYQESHRGAEQVLAGDARPAAPPLERALQGFSREALAGLDRAAGRVVPRLRSAGAPCVGSLAVLGWLLNPNWSATA
jgi:hypothetical protein